MDLCAKPETSSIAEPGACIVKHSRTAGKTEHDQYEYIYNIMCSTKPIFYDHIIGRLIWAGSGLPDSSGWSESEPIYHKFLGAMVDFRPD